MKIKNKQLISLVVVMAALLVAAPVFATQITIGVSSSGQIIPTLPAPPSLSVSGNQITVNWEAAPGTDEYNVFKKKDAGEFVFQGSVTGLSFVDSSLENGVYSYQIQPFVGSLKQDLKNIQPVLGTVSVTTSPPPGGGGGGGSTGGGGGGGGIITQTSPLSAAAQKVDANKDNKIDVLDFNTLMVNWGSASAGNAADFDGDGKVDVFDFNLLMINWTL